MTGPSTIPLRRVRVLAACATTGLLVLAACDTGDGTTLREPTASTTLAPPEVPPPPSEPLDAGLDDPGLGESPSIDSPATDGSSAENPDDAFTADGLRVFTPWADGGSIDLRYTCDGNDSAPSISWAEIPEGTAELALSFVDITDVSSGRPFIHWAMAGIDPGVDRIGENEVPAGAVQGLNFFGDVGYTGPCPDPGTTHTYILTVFALAQQLELADGTPAAELVDVMQTVAIDSASSSGTASR